MKVEIKINLNRRTFTPEEAVWEIAEILRDLAKHIVAGDKNRVLHDCNSNKVGAFKILK